LKKAGEIMPYTIEGGGGRSTPPEPQPTVFQNFLVWLLNLAAPVIQQVVQIVKTGEVPPAPPAATSPTGAATIQQPVTKQEKRPKWPVVQQLLDIGELLLWEIPQSVLQATRNEPEIVQAVTSGSMSTEDAMKILFADEDVDPCSFYPGWEYISRDAYGNFLCRRSNGRSIVEWTEMPGYGVNSVGVPGWEPLSILEQQWKLLSPLEQGIETALSKTTDYASHTYSLDYVLKWVSDREDVIHMAAEDFGVDPVLLMGVLATEGIYDMDYKDTFQDVFHLGDARGIPNVHAGTLSDAYSYLAPQYEPGKNPWDLAGGPTNFQDMDAVGDYAESGDWTGGIRASAMVLRYLQDKYVADPNAGHDPSNLTPEEMAIIFGAYREGISAYSSEKPPITPAQIEAYQNAEMGDQGIMALPVMEYYAELYR
jgi:hypothetical protein